MNIFTPKIISLKFEIVPDPRIMKEVEFYPDGRIKRIIFRDALTKEDISEGLKIMVNHV